MEILVNKERRNLGMRIYGEKMSPILTSFTLFGPMGERH